MYIKYDFSVWQCGSQGSKTEAKFLADFNFSLELYRNRHSKNKKTRISVIGVIHQQISYLRYFILNFSHLLMTES